MNADDSQELFSDSELTRALAVLLKEIHAEPVPESIRRLAVQLQTALDEKLKVRILACDTAEI